MLIAEAPIYAMTLRMKLPAAAAALLLSALGACSGEPDPSLPGGQLQRDSGTADPDAGLSCRLTLCGSACVDTASDATHCGDCQTACAAGQVCSGGRCASSCSPGQTACASDCVDLQSHPQHCGSCERVCPTAQVCSGGMCGCAAGLTACGALCVDARTDRDNCGGCVKQCGVGGTCSQGACQCSDACPAPIAGVKWGCEKRFMYGTNWGWKNFAGDFGGVAAFGWQGVSKAPDAYSADLRQMKAAGANVIRWWMFPRFITEGIVWGTDGAPSGLSGTVVADVQAALQLAEQHDVYLMLTPFSFDNFYPTRLEGGISSRSIRPIVLSAALRAKLIANVIVPIAQAVEASPYRRRMIAWDLMNEPEWAITGANLYGGENFDPQMTLELVTHTEMERFLREVAAALRTYSTAQLTIGGAAIKWARAWTGVNIDFYQFHYYNWVYEWFPYATVTLQSVGMTAKPVVMGEYPMQGLAAIPAKALPARTASQLSADLWKASYAGTLSWSFEDKSSPFNPTELKAFADQHACETKY